MTVPVIRLLLKQYPTLRVTMVSNPFMQPLFKGIDRLEFYGADTKKEFNGLRGLFRLSRDIKSKIPFDAIADLHEVVRTKALRFFLATKPVAVIDKGRKEKKELTRPENKILRPLKSTFQRYADVFGRLGYPVSLEGEGALSAAGAPPEFYSTTPAPVIGIAPFAKHAAKMYPLEKMKEVVRLLNADQGFKILLFGSKKEAEILSGWESEFPAVQSLAGKFSFEEELSIIASLSVMLSMDSANMHLASMFGVPVVSVWGGTHPFLGFYGWGQPLEYAIQENLPCRPSSVFGNKPCPVHGDKGCMQGIEPKQISDRIIRIIRESR